MRFQWRSGLVAAVVGTLVVQLWMCFFFSGGDLIPRTIDITPANYRQARFDFPPQGFVSHDYWLGWPSYPNALTPHSALAHLPAWWFFTLCYPLYGALAVLSFYLYARELGFSQGVAILGGLACGWQGPLLSNVLGAHFAPAALLALMPLALLGVTRSLHRGGWFPAVGAGAVLGMLICLQADHGALVAMLIGALYLTAAVRATVVRPASAWPVLGKLALTVLTSAAVAAPTIQSMYATQIASIQQGGSNDPREKWAWATQWSLPPSETFDQLAPGLFGWRSDWEQGPYWGRIGRQPGWEEHHQGFRNYSISANTVGTAMFVLGLAAALTLVRRRPAAPAGDPPADLGLTPDQLWYGRFCVGAGIVAYLLAFGRWAPFYFWFYHLPYMTTWRNPMKFLVVGNFCVITLAAYACHWWGATAPSALADRFHRVGRGVVIAAAALLLLFWWSGPASESGPGSGLAQQGYRAEELQVIHATQSKTVLAALVVLGALAALLWSRPQPAAPPAPLARAHPGKAPLRPPTVRPRPELIYTVVGLAVVGQLAWVHQHYIEPLHFRQAYRANALIDDLRAAPEPVRVKLLGSDSLLHYHLTYLFPYYHIASVDIPAMSRLPDDYAAFFRALEKQPLREWQLAGVRFLAMPAPLLERVMAIPGLRNEVAGVTLYRASLVPPDGFALQRVAAMNQASHALVTLKEYLPKISLVPGLEVLDDGNAVGQRLATTDWNPRRTLVVDRATATDAAVAGANPDATTAGEVQLQHYTESRVAVTANSPAPGYLLLNDRFDANWRATVNGRPARPFRTDLLLTGVALPAGQSTVVLRYDCPAGPLYVHLLALAVVGLGLAWWWPRRSPGP